MHRKMSAILAGLTLDADGIYSSVLPAAQRQTDEIRNRVRMAQHTDGDLLVEIGRHHSIPAMDRELRIFLSGIQGDGIVVDVGGGWGWHWRGLENERHDLCVVVVDFVRENLKKAAGLLGSMVNRQLFLVHGDATALPFPSSAFDGFWSVQTLQHIPNVEAALLEADRVLRAGGRFASYSLNRARLVELAYRVCGKSYHVHGRRPDGVWLSRSSDDEARVVARVFGAPVTSRYSEVLFHPDLRLQTGGVSSRFGRVDACLSSDFPILAWLARQRSYHTQKPLGSSQSG